MNQSLKFLADKFRRLASEKMSICIMSNIAVIQVFRRGFIQWFNLQNS